MNAERRNLSALRQPPDRAVSVAPPPAPPPTPAAPTKPSRRAADAPPKQRPKPAAPASRPTQAKQKPEQMAADEASTERVSVYIPLPCKQWLVDRARAQQRYVSELVMEALEKHGPDVPTATGRRRRVAVPDGTTHTIVLPASDLKRFDDFVKEKNSTRSALLTAVLTPAAAGK